MYCGLCVADTGALLRRACTAHVLERPASASRRAADVTDHDRIMIKMATLNSVWYMKYIAHQWLAQSHTSPKVPQFFSASVDTLSWGPSKAHRTQTHTHLNSHFTHLPGLASCHWHGFVSGFFTNEMPYLKPSRQSLKLHKTGTPGTADLIQHNQHFTHSNSMDNIGSAFLR